MLRLQFKCKKHCLAVQIAWYTCVAHHKHGIAKVEQFAAVIDEDPLFYFGLRCNPNAIPDSMHSAIGHRTAASKVCLPVLGRGEKRQQPCERDGAYDHLQNRCHQPMELPERGNATPANLRSIINQLQTCQRHWLPRRHPFVAEDTRDDISSQPHKKLSARKVVQRKRKILAGRSYYAN